ncbi:hypothetical protein QVD17_39565 [Tagetes erecta]|uniref:Myb-like domain-containing protein n=1 Tax=Tagetes erecta TaxID=13708 RepID=A0AAD8JSJ3_TARER|nr:hypothetical protein QVD17_39565 [Tagetes erecta]
MNTTLNELMDDDVDKEFVEVMEAHAAEISQSKTRTCRTIQRNRLSPFPNPGFSYFPNHGYSQFTNLGFSQLHNPTISTTQTSTLASHGGSVDESPSPQVKTTKKKKGKAAASSEKQKRQAWSIEEEKLLTKGWLHISNDSIVGNSQKNNDFWCRIHTYFENGSNVVRIMDN